MPDTQHADPNDKLPEKNVWIGRSSQIVNLTRFIVSLMLILSVLPLRMWWHSQPTSLQNEYEWAYGVVMLSLFFLPIIYSYWHWLKIDSHTYRLTTQRLIEQFGIFTRHSDNLELYRVKDLVMVEPFMQYVAGCGTLRLVTSDKTTPIVYIPAIKNPAIVLDLLRIAVEQQRILKGVREFD